MAINIMKLRQMAKRQGMDSSQVRAATREDLEAFLNDNGSSAKRGRKATPVKRGRASTSTRKAAPTKRKPGRPKGSKNKTTTARKSAPAQSAQTGRKAKRQTTTATKPKAKSNGEAGRMIIGTLDFSNYDEADWNPRRESATGRVFALLRKFRGNVDKVFNAIIDDDGLYNLVAPAKSRLGNKRNVEERDAVVMYRINRTRFDFAVRTGQHEKATNRSNAAPQEGTTKRKRGSATKTARKPVGRPRKAEQPKRRGRPPKAQAKAQKPSQSRGRGRPRSRPRRTR